MPSCFYISKTSVVDRPRLDASPDPDPNPAFHFDADPDPDPTPSFTYVEESDFFKFSVTAQPVYILCGVISVIIFSTVFLIEY
jgi:hypothetical protein